jgi:hypothetical protein
MPTLHWVGKDKVVSHHDVPFRVLDKVSTFNRSFADQVAFATIRLNRCVRAASATPRFVPICAVLHH